MFLAVMVTPVEVYIQKALTSTVARMGKLQKE